MVKEIFGQSEFRAITFEIAKEIAGVALFLVKNPAPQTIEIFGLCA